MQCKSVYVIHMDICMDLVKWFILFSKVASFFKDAHLLLEHPIGFLFVVIVMAMPHSLSK